jgi:hypothetical protein
MPNLNRDDGGSTSGDSINGHVMAMRIETGPNGATAVPGVWIAGNTSEPMAQVVNAAASGLAAASAIIGEASRHSQFTGSQIDGALRLSGISAMVANDAAGGLAWSPEILRTETGLGMRNLADGFESRGGHYVKCRTGSRRRPVLRRRSQPH